jgi:polar amino acid transport system substrate-binding protein
MVDRWMTRRSQKMPDLPASGTNGTLVVGISSGGFPFSAVQNNELAGFDVELARRFGAHIGKQVRFADQEFSGLIAALVSGKIDVIIADMFVTEERQKQIDFSDPYFEQDSVAFTVKANTVAPGATAAAALARASFVDRVVSSFQSNIIHEQRYLLIWDGLKTTALIAVLATLFGTALGALVCYMRMSALAVLRVPARIYISVLRGIPVVVLLMLIFYVVFASVNINPVLVAVLAFGMNFAAYVSEIFRSGIEGVDKGQSEAGTAMGFTRTQTFGFIILPQMIQRILPVYKGEFISLVKMTSIVGYIAVQDLTKASDIIRSRTFDPFFPLIMVAVLYFVIAWVLMQALEYVERITDPKYRQRTAVAR